MWSKNISAALVGFLALSAGHAYALVLTPGSIYGGDPSTGGGGGRLYEYSKAGVITQTLDLTVPGNVRTVDGLSIVGGNVYITGTAAGVGLVNLTTGAVTSLFTGPGSSNQGVESLGDHGGNLLFMRFDSPIVFETTPTGTAVSSITLPRTHDVTGLDSDGGNRLFVADYVDGSVYTYDFSGTLISSFNTGLGSQALSGLGYDRDLGTIWVASGFGADRIHQFTTTGTPISSFAAGTGFIDSLDVLSIPEPATLALMSLAVPALARRRPRA